MSAFRDRHKGLRVMGSTVGVVALVAPALGVLAGVVHAAEPSVTFATHVDFAAGELPYSVAVGDLDGDAVSDLAIAHRDSASVSVLLGDGTGGFAPKSDFSTGGWSYSVAVGDLNGDAVSDLAVANYDSDTVSVLLADGTGGFAPRTDFVTGSWPTSVAVGDLNGDTFPDLAVANNNSDSVSVLLGDGTGGFADRTDFVTGSWPTSVAVGDLNGDTVSDLAVANNDSDTVSVLLADGTGGFAPKSDFAVATGPASVAVGDLNGDTALDLVVANGLNALSVLLGDGTGGFAPRTDLFIGTSPISVAVGDLNGDTFLDLATANGSSNGVSVLLGDGTGGFAPRTDFATNYGPVSVVMDDLNGDALLDLAVANLYTDTVSVLLHVRPPDAPTIIRTATAGNTSATVSWTAPTSDGGSPITDYVVTPYIGYYPLAPQTFSSTATTQTITGLTNGTEYRFRVQAINAVGTSAYSKVTNPVTPAITVPGAPTVATAIAGDGQATVSWTAPASNGGSPVTGYVVTPYIGYFPLPSQAFASTATTQVVTGLTNATTYRFRVQAVNAIGTGGYSTASNAVTPAP
jgi:ankyrin repeat protein